MGLSRERVTAAKNIVLQVAAVSVLANTGSQVLNLAILGAIADQVSELLSKKITLVVSGTEELATKVAMTFTTLLGLKGPECSGKVTVLAGESALAASVAQSCNTGLLVYLSHAAGVHQQDGKVAALYDPACPVGTPASCLPGTELVTAAWELAQKTCPVVIASATQADAIRQIMAGQDVGTLFDAVALSTTLAAPEAHTCRDMAVRARTASRLLQAMSTAERVAILNRVADALVANEAEILAENAKDMEEAKGKAADSLLQRLGLKPAKIAMLAEGIRSIANQEEPVGRLTSKMEIAQGLMLEKVTAPIGVLLIIFEARPDALPQIASLALRSGNGLLLKGGKEARRSNAVLHRVITQAIGPLGPDLIALVETREEISELLGLDDVIDLVIPRGGNALVTHIQRNTRIPVLGHADGVCHMYIDEAANLEMALKLMVDSKVDYPAACNAVETVLLHSAWLPKGGLEAVRDAFEAAGVKIFAAKRSISLLPGVEMAPALRHEYSALACTVEVVDSMQEAVDYLHANGSGHTEVIITEDTARAEEFMRVVDSACVFHNASSRFSDGFRFGLGAEVGISTSRIHARGPVGVEGLLTSKWLMRGAGQIVAKDTGITYTHKRIL